MVESHFGMGRKEKEERKGGRKEKEEEGGKGRKNEGKEKSG